MRTAPTVPLSAALALLLLIPAVPAGAGEGTYSTDEIVITATRTPHGIEEVPGSITIIDSDEIEAAASPDFKTVLEQAPSIFVNDTGLPGGVATPLLRGSRSTQVLVLLDGLRLANAQSSFFNLNDLPVPLERVERIEVLPVPASALYGADALGGVINIITKSPAEETSLSLSQGGGSYGHWRSAAGVNWGREGIGLRVDGVLRNGDGHRDNGDFDFENLSVGTRFAAEAVDLDLGWNYLQREAGSPGSDDFPSPLARQDDEAHYLRVGAKVHPGGSWELLGALFYDRQRREYTNPEFSIDSLHKNSKGGVDGQATYDAGRRGLLTVGGEWIRDDIESTDDGEHDTTRWALFVQEEIPVGLWTFTATARLDEHSVYGTEINPRFALLRKLPASWRGWLNVSRGFRAPNFDDLFWTGSFGVGNPDLEPETSWNYEAGLAKDWQGRGSLRLAGFLRDVDDLIEWGDPDGDFVFSPENISSARFRGVEIDASLKPLSWLSIPLGYQFLDAEDRDTGEDIPGRVRHLLRGALRCRFGSLTAALEGSYADHYDTPGSTDWNYTVFAAATRWSGTAGPLPLALSLRLDNLFDDDFEKVEGFPMPGRNVYAEAILNF